MNYLGQLAQNYEILGPSRTWDLNKIEIVGSILAGLTEQQFRELQIEACKGIKPNVIRMIPEKKLKVTFLLLLLLCWFIIPHIERKLIMTLN